MASIRARIVNAVLPLLGIKSFFSEPDKVAGRLAKMRARKPQRPSAKMWRRFDITEDTSRGYSVITVAPKGARRDGAPHLLYLHGGGYIMDVEAVHWNAVSRLCEMLGASATVPVYPLAPEHKAPEILSAMRALYADIAESYGAKNITIMGDSAGGGMSVALASMIRDDGGDLPAKLVLFSPWLDATGTAEGQAEIEKKDNMLAIVGLRGAGKMYAGGLELTDPRISPLFGDYSGLPPMAIFAGTSDILVVDARRLVAKLQAQGSPPHEYHEYADMFHVWMLIGIPEGKQALRQTAEFIGRA
ncbi:MAG: alpha/beta hydrolase [Sphingorhabdus sp.]